MTLQAQRCEMCGGTLEPDPSGEFAVCGYCQTHHSLETGQRLKLEVSVSVQVEGTSLREMMERADTLLGLREWSKARDNYQAVADMYPNHHEGWWGLLRVEVEDDFEHLVNPQSPQAAKAVLRRETCYQRAIQFADDEAAAKIKALYEPMRAAQRTLDQAEVNRVAAVRRGNKTVKVLSYLLLAGYLAAMFLYSRPLLASQPIPGDLGFMESLWYILYTYCLPWLVYCFLSHLISCFSTEIHDRGINLFIALSVVNGALLAYFDSSMGIASTVVVGIILVIISFISGLVCMFAGTLIGTILKPLAKIASPKAKQPAR